jgi:hypothetical protein
MGIPDDAPPLAVYCAPYGGLGLKTKSYAKARARIDGLLDIGTETVHELAELEVIEPAVRPLVEALCGRLDHGVGISGGAGAKRTDLAAAVADHGHTFDALAAEAWRRFGEPNACGARQQRTGETFIVWTWIVNDAAQTTPALDAWSPFAAAHDQEMFDDYSTRVGVRGIWETRLMVAGGKVVAPPYPPSRIHAHLRSKHASAFLDIVLPHDAATDGFLADYQAVNRALGMTVPMKGYKLCAPKKKGDGRVYKKLPGL